MENVIFVGMGRSVVSWYRCALPALYLGAEWIGTDQTMLMATGLIRRPWNGAQSLFDYEVVVWQQPRSPVHRQIIRDLRKAGVKVLVEVDDYLHGVRRMKDHDFHSKKEFSKKDLEGFVLAMRESDGLICSTPYLESKYGSNAPRSWVCLNGLDMGRYEKSRPEHQTVNIGWSGATGHGLSFGNIRSIVREMLDAYDNTTFISVGQGFASEWQQELGNRVLAIPFSSLEVYPNAMCMMDIGIAPARDTSWYRAKSQLRYYEHCALGIPTIGDPIVYPEIDPGTGFTASTDEEWRQALVTLIENHDLRIDMGRAARAKALAEFDMRVRKDQWAKVIDEVLAG